MPDRSIMVRFDDETVRLLRVLCSSLGLSMDQLARDMVTRESHLLAAGLGLDMSGTIAALDAFRAPMAAVQAAEFAPDRASGVKTQPVVGSDPSSAVPPHT